MNNALFIKVAVLAGLLSFSSHCFPQSRSTSNAESAKQFVENLYASYGPNADPADLLGKNAKDAFDPSLIALVRTDVKAAYPDVGALDYDPICQCQDWDITFPDLKIDVRSANAKRALAIVTWSLDNTPTKLELTLVRRKEQWRVFDILVLSRPGPYADLRTTLQGDIQQLSRERSKDKK